MQEINLDWQFKKLPGLDIREMDSLAGIDESGLEPVSLPHTWYEDGAAYKGTVLYKKTLRIEAGADQRVFLRFGAADRFCKVFVNGRYIGAHKGGYSAFTLEISDACRRGAQNEIAVLLDNRSFDEISPLAGDFTVFGGLYRTVALCVTAPRCFDRTFYGTDGVILRAAVDGEDGVLRIENHTLGDVGGARVAYCVRDPDGAVVLDETQPLTPETVLRLPHPALWRGKQAPALYTLQQTLLFDAEPADTVTVRFGFRQVSVDPQTGFSLNGVPMKIHGVAKHQDFGGVFSATTDDHLAQDLRLILEIGANGVRLSHYQHPQRMYDLCDEAGLVVWAEIPMLKFLDDDALCENAAQQLRELIYQNIHHPSICFWGIQNEIAIFGESEPMYTRMRALSGLVRALDDTRLSACANLYSVSNDSPLNTLTQVVGYNIYFGWYYGQMPDNADFVDKFHRDNPTVPLGITEYGVDCNLAFHSDTPQVRDYSEEFQALYHETVYPLFRDRDYLWGTFVWNLFDFSSEIRNEGGVRYRNSKGLVTYDRQTRKDAFYYYKAQWSDEPFVRIAERRYVNRAKDRITVKVYTNCPRVTLTAGGVCRTAEARDGICRFADVPLQPGENEVTATAGACSDTAMFRRVDAPDERYRYVDPNPGINVKNWFVDAAEEEKLFPTGMFSIRDASNRIVEYGPALDAVAQFSPKLADQMRARNGSMPLERILHYMKDEFTDDDCKRLNAALTKVKKP